MTDRLHDVRLSRCARVLLVESRLVFAESLRVCLESVGYLTTVAPVDSLDAVVAVARDVRPHVVLVDVGEGIGDGVELVESLTMLGAIVIVVEGVADPAHRGMLIEGGAAGVMRAQSSLGDLEDAVASALAGRSLVSDEELRELRETLQVTRRQRSRFERLTPREASVLGRLMDGRMVAQIAANDFVSEGTVRSQIHSILRKLEVTSQLGAVAAARRARWAPPEVPPRPRSEAIARRPRRSLEACPR